MRGLVHGFRRHRARTHIRRLARSVHYVRRQLHVRQRIALVLQYRGAEGGKPCVPPRQRRRLGRRGAVDDHTRRPGICRRQQLGHRLYNRSRHIRHNWHYRGAYLAAIHTLRRRRQSLHQRPLRSAHNRLRSAHRQHRRPYRNRRPPLDRADGAVGRLRIYQLLVIRQQHPCNRHAYGHRRRPHRGRHPTHLHGRRPQRKTVDDYRRRFSHEPLRLRRGVSNAVSRSSRATLPRSLQSTAREDAYTSSTKTSGLWTLRPRICRPSR